MRHRRFHGTLWGLALALIVGPSASGYIANDRWNNTATNGNTGSKGTPVTVTWSLAADGTQVAGGDGLRPSDMITWLDANMGAGPGGSNLTLRPWFWLFEASFDRISELSGVTYAYEPNDDGVNWSGGNSGNLGVRGDVRIGGKTWGSSTNVLASNFFPDYGDMQLNTDKTSFYFNSGSNYRRFRNTIMHEAGHGLGISHVQSNNAGFLMEPSISTAFDGPQLDDILALHRNHGDVHEKNGGNDAWSNATALGTLTDTSGLIIGTRGDNTFVNAGHTDFISIDDNGDHDYLSFTITEQLEVTLDLTPKGPTYNVGPQNGTQTPFDASSVSDLTLRLYDTNGTSLLQTANANGAGSGETITQALAAGTYFARVSGAANNIQLYQLDLTATDIVPDELRWFGLLSGTWQAGGDPNFKNAGGTLTAFQSGDNATFDDTANYDNVQIIGDVDPTRVTIDAVGDYTFFGPGSIVGNGELVKNNTNTFDLQTDGNSYTGDTTVNAGTMVISGNANAMVSAITVNAGGTLVMDATDASTMGSTFTVNAGGTLQLGTMTSDADLFPDSPAGLVNEGAVLVLDTETVTNMSGTGLLQVDHETAKLGGNASFNGEVVVNGPGVAQVTDTHGLGSTTGGTTLNDGGTLLASTSLTLSENVSLNGAGGTIAVDSGADLTLDGAINTIGGAPLAPGDPAAVRYQELYGHAHNASCACDHCSNHAGNPGEAESTTNALTLDAQAGSSLTVDADIQIAAGSVTVTGGGVVTISSIDNVYTGDTIVENNATLVLSGHTGDGPTTVQNGGKITGGGAVSGDLVIAGGGVNQPAGPHTFGGIFAPTGSDFPLAVGGDYTQQAGGELEVELLSTSLFDRMNVVGHATLAGALDILQFATPSPGDAFTILNANTLSGHFDQTQVTGYTVDADHAIAVLYEDSDADTLEDRVRLFATLIGDANGDGGVDLVDLERLALNWGSTDARWQDGDFNYDGQADLLDLNALALYYNQSISAPVAIPAVPEPASLALLTLTALTLRRRR